MMYKHETLQIRLILTPLNPVILCFVPLAAHPIPLDWTLSKGKLHQCSGLIGHPCYWPEVEPVQKATSSSFTNKKTYLQSCILQTLQIHFKWGKKTKACTSPIFLGIFHFNIGTGNTSDLL
jgi:hypothetical protein